MTIRRIGKKYRLVSRKGRNLGTFSSKKKTVKREKQVVWFKNKKKNPHIKFI